MSRLSLLSGVNREVAFRRLAPFDLDQNETALFASKSKK